MCVVAVKVSNVARSVRRLAGGDLTAGKLVEQAAAAAAQAAATTSTCPPHSLLEEVARTRDPSRTPNGQEAKRKQSDGG